MGGMRSEWEGGGVLNKLLQVMKTDVGKKGFRKMYFCEFEIKFKTILFHSVCE